VSARVNLDDPVSVSLGTTLTRIVAGDGVREIQVSCSADLYLVYDDTLDDGDPVPATARHRIPAGVWPVSIVTGKRLLLAGVSSTTATLLGGRAGQFPPGAAAASLAALSGVPSTRAISTTSPLGGGGDLSADRTLTVDDATTSTKGVVKLAGDLAGTAALPTISSSVITAAARTVLDDATVAAMLATLGGVPTARTISTTSPLSGGGDLSADRTLTVDDATTSTKGVVKLAGQLGGTATLPTVTGLTETAGPTALAMGSVADGQVLKRSGTSVVGATLSGATAGATIYDPDSLASGVSLIAPSQEFQNSQSVGGWTNTWDLGTAGTSVAIGPRGIQVDVGTTNAGGSTFAGVYHSTFPVGDFAVLARIGTLTAGAGFTSSGLVLMQGTSNTDDLYLGGIRGISNGNNGSVSTWSNYGTFQADILLGSSPSSDVFVLIRYGATNKHVTTFIGPTLDSLFCTDFDRALGYTPTLLGLLGWNSSGKKHRIICPYIRVIADTYPGATWAFPPRINGALLVGL
jgi:hypothetical protein